jgi:hypothetical protein
MRLGAGEIDKTSDLHRDLAAKGDDYGENTGHGATYRRDRTRTEVPMGAHYDFVAGVEAELVQR